MNVWDHKQTWKPVRKGKLTAGLRRCPSGQIRAHTPASDTLGLMATMGREGILAEAPVQLAEPQLKFPRQGKQLVNWVEARVMRLAV